MGEALVPTEQQTVIFYEDELTAICADDKQIYVAVTQMCNSLGLVMASCTVGRYVL